MKQIAPLVRFLSLSFFLLLYIGNCNVIIAQTPFTCEGQYFMVNNPSGVNGSFGELTFENPDATTEFAILNNSLATPITAIAYRKTDNLIYGIDEQHNLIRIDANGNIEILSPLLLTNGYTYNAAAISSNGNTLIFIGGSNGLSQEFVSIPVNGSSYVPSRRGVSPNNLQIDDIAFDPTSNVDLKGFDSKNNRLVRINSVTGAVNTSLPPTVFMEKANALFYDAYGQLYAYGDTGDGQENGLFAINKNSGQVDLLTTGVSLPNADGCSCPYTVMIESSVMPNSTGVCAEATYTFTFQNTTGFTQSNLILENPFSTNFIIKQVKLPLFTEGNIAFGVGYSNLVINSIGLFTGVTEIEVTVEAKNGTPEGVYDSQALLRNLSPALGNERVSDNPATLQRADATPLEVKSFIVVEVEKQMCEGDVVLLEASEFGNQFEWEDGTTDSNIEITEEGIYQVTANDGCRTSIVRFIVERLEPCPFQVNLSHTATPEEIHGCEEVIYSFIVSNSTLIEQTEVVFESLFPESFKITEIIQNPFGGNIEKGVGGNELKVTGMSLLRGIDALIVEVQVADVVAGVYKTGGILSELQLSLGSTSISDNPLTEAPEDSTTLTVLTAVPLQDATLEEELCEGATLRLDASEYGQFFEWQDGSTQPFLEVTIGGNYEVWYDTGCQTANLFFNVSASSLQAHFLQNNFSIALGDSVLLQPNVSSSNDNTLSYLWSNDTDTPIACVNCPFIYASPFETTVYNLIVQNDKGCAVHLTANIEVENSTAIQTPTAFSPNDDGINDIFYLQSRNTAKIIFFQVYNRWGQKVFEQTTGTTNMPSIGWDGRLNFRTVDMGIYIWQAEVEFLNRQRKLVSGSVTVLP